MKNKRGFTLMEMMVVVLILAGLAAIAYPTYSKVIMNTRIAEAFSLGEIVREAEQRALAVNGSYFDAFTTAHITGNTRLIKSGDVEVNSDGTLQKKNYKVTLKRTGDSESKGSCMDIEYYRDGVDTPVFTITMLVEDSRIWCKQATGITGVCETIPSTETDSNPCNS